MTGRTSGAGDTCRTKTAAAIVDSDPETLPQSRLNASGLSSSVSRYQAKNSPSWQTPTCQSVVDSIVSLPEPQHRRRQRVHLRQALFSHLFKMLGARPAAEEVVHVLPHGAQHLSGICWGGTMPQK